MDDARVGRALVPSDRVTAQSMAAASEALLVTVAAEQPDALVTIEVKGGGGIAYGHLVIDVGRFARATVVLDHVGSGTFGASVEVVAGDGADVTVVSLQDWADDAVHVGAHAGPGRVVTRATGTSSRPSAAIWCGSARPSASPDPVEMLNFSASASPMPASTTSTGSSSTTSRRSAAAG